MTPAGDELVGREVGRVTFSVEPGKVAELGRALHDDGPWDEVLPPTWTVLADPWRPGGLIGRALDVGLDLGRLLHGEASWEHLAPVRIGDELTASTVVEEVRTREGARGGTMTLVTFLTTFTGRDGVLVCRLRDTFIETAAA